MNQVLWMVSLLTRFLFFFFSPNTSSKFLHGSLSMQQETKRSTPKTFNKYNLGGQEMAQGN